MALAQGGGSQHADMLADIAENDEVGPDAVECHLVERNGHSSVKRRHGVTPDEDGDVATRCWNDQGQGRDLDVAWRMDR